MTFIYYILFKIRYTNSMIKKYKDYILLLGIFLLFIFSSNINRFLSVINPNLDTDKIVINYNKYLKEELDNIKKVYNLEYNDNLDLIVSRVKYRNVYEYSNTLTIFKGFKDGVEKGDAVLTNAGLVGIISKTYDSYSIVSLITNKSSNISVLINDAVGVLKMDYNNLIVSNISNYQNVYVGDKIYTSGLGNLPRNIYIGKVSSVKINETGIEKQVTVDIDNRLNKLDYLYIWRLNND